MNYYMFTPQLVDVLHNVHSSCVQRNGISYVKCKKQKVLPIKFGQFLLPHNRPNTNGCVTTTCRVCVKLPTKTNAPRKCAKVMTTCSNRCSAGCTDRWGRCVRKALTRTIKKARSLPANKRIFQCFVPPQQKTCT